MTAVLDRGDMFEKVIALYGIPRSGTSWLGQILESCPDVVYRYQPLFSYRFKNRLTVDMDESELDVFFKELYLENNDDFLNQTDKRNNGEYPVFTDKAEKPSVLAYKETRYLYTIPVLLNKYRKIKIIGIVRNPYDELESWINASSEYKPEWDIYQEWELATSKNEYRPENYFGYYKWKEFLKMNVDMQRQFPDKFKTVRYEDLEADAELVVKELFDFAGMKYSKQTEEFIRSSQSNTVDSKDSVYRKKQTARKRNYYLPQDIREKIAQDLREFKAAQVLGYR